MKSIDILLCNLLEISNTSFTKGSQWTACWILLLILPSLSLAAGAAQASLAPPVPIEFDHVENGTLFFKNSAKGSSAPITIKTPLFELSFLGSLRAPEGGLPYFLFSGKPCQDCQVDREIYSIRPSGEKPVTFVYPGKILDPKSKRLLLQSRAFYGQCLYRKGDVYVVFQRELVDRHRQHRLMNSVFIAEAGKDYFQENLLERRLPSLKSTLQLVKSRKCYEIEGRNRFMLAKPLDLHPHDNGDENGDSSDDALDNALDDEGSPGSEKSETNSPLLKPTA